MSTHRQLAAIIFTDIVGYTALMQENEQKAVALIKHYNSTLEKTVAAHEGKVLNYYGDGSLCIFSSATEALNCAIDMQRELQNEPVVPLRIGLHIGEIFFEDGKALGDGVNIASRIQSLGQANTILFSKEIFDKIRNHPEFKAVSLGQFDFKNVDEPMEVFALTNEGLIVPERERMDGKLKEKALNKETNSSKKWVFITAIIIILVLISFFAAKKFTNNINSGNPKKENSIAVLYFTNMSGDPKEEYFSDGITEEIITRLSMISGLKVKSRTSVLQYKDEKKSTKEIAGELGVNNILEGSLRKQGNKIRITAQLIDAATDDHIWSVDYDRELKDIFEVQTDIAQNIATKFQIKLSEATRKKVETPPTLNTEAYDLYLKAASLSFIDIGAGGEQANTQKAIFLLRQVIQLDPSFSDAYALLSGNYTYYSRDAENPKYWVDSAMVLAKTAIKYNPERIDGYSALAYVYNLKGNSDEALKWSLKAHELVPFSTAGNIINIYAQKKEYGNAIEWIMKAIQFDPSEPGYYLAKAEIFYSLGLLDSTKNYFNMAKRIKPEQFYAMGSGFEYYLTTGNYEEFQRLNRTTISNDEREYDYQIAVFYLFRRNWKKADSLYTISSHPDDIDAGLVKIHLGTKEQGSLFLKKAIDRRMRFETFNNTGTTYDICRAYAALEDSRYIEYFNKALEKGWHNYSFFENDPFFDFVKNKPEFKKLEQELDERNEQFKADMYAGMKRFYEENSN